MTTENSKKLQCTFLQYVPICEEQSWAITEVFEKPSRKFKYARLLCSSINTPAGGASGQQAVTGNKSVNNFVFVRTYLIFSLKAFGKNNR